MDKERELPRGVEVRNGRIRIVFSYRGTRYRETLPWAASPGGIERAGKFRAQIAGEIRHGVFEYAKHFPNSRNVARQGLTFSECAQRYLDWRAKDRQWSNSYRLEQAKLLNQHWLPTLWQRPIDQITEAELRLVADTITAGPKTYNNALVPLHGTFGLAIQDGLIVRDPSAVLVARHAPHEDEPDPFTPEEVAAILAHVRAKHGLIWWSWFAFAFWTGFRPSEQRALVWQEVGRDTVTVRRAMVRGRLQERTKTRRNRLVRLAPVAQQALATMRAETALAGEHVFIHPVSRIRFRDADTATIVWRSTLKALGLRYRTPYQTRHTCATMFLMAGMSPKFVASMLGHSVVTLEKHYAKWMMDGELTDAQMRKLDVLAR